jgi:hypothetical protein
METWISESMTTRLNGDSSGLSEEKAMEASDTANTDLTNQESDTGMREGVADSPLIAAIWMSESQSYDSCPNSSRCT